MPPLSLTRRLARLTKPSEESPRVWEIHNFQGDSSLVFVRLVTLAHVDDAQNDIIMGTALDAWGITRLACLRNRRVDDDVGGGLPDRKRGG